MIMLKFMDFF